MNKIKNIFLIGAMIQGIGLSLPAKKGVEENKNILINILKSGNLNASGTIVTELKNGGYKVENIMTREERLFSGIGNFHDGYPDGKIQYADDINGVIKICDSYHTNHVDKAIREIIFPRNGKGIDFESNTRDDNDVYNYIYNNIKEYGKELFLNKILLYRVINNIRKKLEYAEKNDSTKYEKYIDSQVTFKELVLIINIPKIIEEEKELMKNLNNM